MNNFFCVGIIGAGQMGSGIAAACMLQGLSVKLVDFSPEALNKSKLKIQDHLHRLDVSLSTIDQLLSCRTEITILEEIDLVIEAIPEIFDLKQKLYKALSKVVKQDTIVATNTSSFPIAQLAGSIIYPERFIGIHFMNPVLKMNLVEIIPSNYTSTAVINSARDFVHRLKKVEIISADQPGFIVNRLLIPMINDAFKALESKVASREDIDMAMEKGGGFPMGPLKLGDFIGLDTCLSIMETLNKAWPHEGYSPSSLLQSYVKEGKLGRKTQQGVYSY